MDSTAIASKTGFDRKTLHEKKSPRKIHFNHTRQNILTKSAFKPAEEIKTEAVAQSCSVKKVFLEISQNLQENTCATVFLMKLLASGVFLWILQNF